MNILPRIIEKINLISDQVSPLLWENPVRHYFIWCQVCRSNIVPGKVRDAYVDDFSLSHFVCPCCGLDHYLDLTSNIPKPVSKYLINKYADRFRQRPKRGHPSVFIDGGGLA